MNNTRGLKLKNLIQTHYDNVAGIVVMKNNQIEFESYFNEYSKDDTLHIASLTKSIISLLMGIALDRGAIKSIEQKVLDFFPTYKIKRGEKTIQDITIRHLLTMTAPYKFTYEPYTKVYGSDDWTKSALDLLGGRGELGEFKYTTVGIQVLCGVLVAATDQSVLDFAAEYFFEPLGIDVPLSVNVNSKEEYLDFIKNRDVSGWVIDPAGTHTAGWGLALSTRDITKIGQLYCNSGMWEGKEIISLKWIRESNRVHSQWNNLFYGYLWWIMDGNNAYAALGDGGNVIYVSPSKNIVIGITSRFMPRAKDRIELIEKHIIPLLER